MEDSNLIARQLMVYRHVLVAVPDYLKRFPPINHPTELRKHQLLCYGDWFHETTWTFNRKNIYEKISVEYSLSMNDFNGLQLAIEQGLGISKLPSIMCNKALENGTLIEVLPRWKFGYSTDSSRFPQSIPVTEIYLAL